MITIETLNEFVRLGAEIQIPDGVIITYKGVSVAVNRSECSAMWIAAGGKNAEVHSPEEARGLIESIEERV